MVYGHKTNGKGMVLWKIVSLSGDRHGKKFLKKYSMKDTMSIKLVLWITWSGPK